MSERKIAKVDYIHAYKHTEAVETTFSHTNIPYKDVVRQN